jgi:ribosomal protein S18 acetylase RimI-like enzyme
MTALLKKLTAVDAAAYQALRLEGLLHHACEFGAAFEEEAGLSCQEVGARLDQSLIFGGFVDGKLLAIAGYRRSERLKKQHKGELFGVYVGKEGRRRGLGEAVVRHVIAKAGAEVEQLLATVASMNLPAKALYEKVGFVTFGHEPRAHKVGDRYYDQDHMVLMLA